MVRTVAIRFWSIRSSRLRISSFFPFLPAYRSPLEFSLDVLVCQGGVLFVCVIVHQALFQIRYQDTIILKNRGFGNERLHQDEVMQILHHRIGVTNQRDILEALLQNGPDRFTLTFGNLHNQIPASIRDAMIHSDKGLFQRIRHGPHPGCYDALVFHVYVLEQR